MMTCKLASFLAFLKLNYAVFLTSLPLIALSNQSIRIDVTYLQFG